MFFRTEQKSRNTDSFSASRDQQVKILPISEKYIQDLRAAWDVVAREKRFLALTEAPSDQEVYDFVLHNLKVGNPHLIALANSQLIGWCDLVRLRRPTMNHRGTLSVGLLPGWRGQGIGNRIITQCIRLAWNRGFRRIELVVRADNLSAITLYQRLGFKTEGRHCEAFILDDCYYDLIDMALLHPSLNIRGSF